MIQKIKSKFQSENNKKITSNFIALSILHATNILLPLITFPYLVRVLGIEMFGLIAFSQAFLIYFSLIADYGFNLSGIREVSVNKYKQNKLIQVFNSIMIARLILTVFGFIILTLIVFSFEKFSKDWELYLLSYGVVIGTFLFPSWFFQGIEKMKYITILNVISKSIFTIAILILVNKPSDFLLVPLFNSLGYIFIGFISLYIIKRDFNIKFEIQKIKRIKVQFIKGWHLFVSRISISLYTATNTFLLGIFTDNTIVGYYAIAEKAVRVFTFLFTPFNQSIYPHIVYLMKTKKNEGINFVKNSLSKIFILSFILSILTFLFAENIFQIIFGNHTISSVDVFLILIPIILINPISSIIYNIYLPSIKKDKFLSYSTIFGVIFNFILLIILYQIIDSKLIATAISLSITEISLFVIGLVIFIKTNKEIKDNK